MFPWADASSASLARPSTNFSLSVFTLYLTALFAVVHCSCTAHFAALALFLPHLHFVDNVCIYQLFLLIFLSQNIVACAGSHLLDLLPLCVLKLLFQEGLVGLHMCL